MTKKKSRSEVEHLRGLVREKDKELRRLKKQVKQNSKFENQDIWEDYETEKELEIKESKVKCDKCKSSNTSIVDLNIKKILVCQDCKFRKLWKK